MLKNILVTLAILAPMCLMAQTEKPYTVKITCGNEPLGKAELVRYTLSKGQRRDTAQAVNGQLTLKGSVDAERQKGQLLLSSGKEQRSYLFYLEPGAINIKYDPATKQFHVAGTTLNNDLEVYNRLFYHFLDTLHADHKSEPNYQFSPLVQEKKVAVMEQFVKTHRNSAVSLDELNQFAMRSTNTEKVQQLFKQLSPALQQSATGMELQNRIKGMNIPKIGSQAPNFTIPDMEGKNVSLSSFKGKYVLVDFWATWCAPCIAEIPYQVKAYDAYKDKNFDIISISLDRPDSKALWIKRVKEYNMRWTQVSELKWWNGTSALLYHINSVPANFLLDPSGKVIAMNLRGEELQQKLATVIPGGRQFTIDGKIASDTAVTGKIYLAYNDKDEEQRDSTTLVNNTYHFTESIADGAIQANVSLEDRTLPNRNGRFKGFSQFYVAAGQTTAAHGPRFSDVKIDGSAVQQDADAFSALRKKHDTPEKELAMAFIGSHPASWYSFVLLDERVIRAGDLTTEQADSLYGLLSPDIKEYARVKTLKSLLDGRKVAVIGNRAPELSMHDQYNKVVNLSDYKGKYVLIDFWASWCHPCRAENPNVTAAYHKYKDKGLNILSISLDATRDKWLEAVEHDKLEWTQVSELKGFSEVADKYGVHSIPRNFLIGPDGKIVAMDLRGEELDKRLEDFFK
jgi:peroxiredoxin